MLHSLLARINRPQQTLENGADSAPYREPVVVHCGFGRLRVHLPHWPGTESTAIAEPIRRLPGVTYIEPNPLTGNVLILFEPKQTSAAALLGALPALAPDSPNPPVFQSQCAMLPAAADEKAQPIVVAAQPVEPHPAGSVIYVTGTTRMVYKALGWSSVGMAVVGAILPGIPTAPFVILAGYFFTRSSPQAHAWLRQTRWFGPMLRDWEEHRAVRRGVRNAALALIGGSMVFTAFLGLSTAMTATIMTMQAIGIAIVLSLRVVESSAPAPAAAT
jgi:uncharacterized membrane protein YbaN (DUF454 family)